MLKSVRTLEVDNGYALEFRGFRACTWGLDQRAGFEYIFAVVNTVTGELCEMCSAEHGPHAYRIARFHMRRYASQEGYKGSESTVLMRYV